MKTLLRIDSSASGQNSTSRLLLDEFVANWLQKNPSGKVIARDVDANPLPHYTHEVLGSLFTPEEQRSDAQKAIVAVGDTLIKELKSADVIAISAPIYNFSIPSTLKSYFDYISRAGETFKYTETGPVGLLSNEAYVFTSSGSFLEGTPYDHQMPYIKTFLSFLGINLVETFTAGGQAMGEAGQQALEKTKASISAL